MRSTPSTLLLHLQERADYSCQLPGELSEKARQLEEERLEKKRRTGRDGTGMRTALSRCGNRDVYSGIPTDAGARRLCQQKIGDWEGGGDGCKKYYDQLS